ncbi:MAG TPA: lipid II flippase MurJ [Anaerolineales bacterium]|nr:lipid II flippase MurJ [Anaerolineales bacterium]
MKKLSFLTRITLLLGFFFALDKLFAILRGIIILREFQLSATLDSFYFADLLPSWEVAVFSGSALAMALIPVLSQTLTLRGRQAMWDAFSRIANLAFIVTGIAAILAAVFAEPIIHFWIAPGISLGQQQFTANLMRIDLIATFIFSISGLVIAALQTNQHFLLPAIAPILYNVGQIFGALILAPSKPFSFGPVTLPAFGFGVYGLVYGVILGAALHLAIQIPGLIHYGFRWTPSLDIRQPALIEMFKVLWPRLLTAFGVQLMFSMRANLASRLSAGAFSAISNGWMIMQVPETLLGTAIATAMLPTLSELAARADWNGFRQTIERALRVLIALTLPAGAILAAGIHPLLRAVFHLDEAGTDLLTLTTRVYMLTLCGYALQEIAARALYARKEALTPLATILVRLFVYLAIGITGLIFFQAIGAPVIAFAEISLTIEAILMLLILGHRLNAPIQIDGVLLKGLAAALLGGATAYGLAAILPGGAVITAILGMLAGTALALVIVHKEVRLLLDL